MAVGAACRSAPEHPRSSRDPSEVSACVQTGRARTRPDAPRTRPGRPDAPPRQRKGNSNTTPPTARASRHGPLRRAARASRQANRRVAPPRQTSHRSPQTYTSHHREIERFLSSSSVNCILMLQCTLPHCAPTAYPASLPFPSLIHSNPVSSRIDSELKE